MINSRETIYAALFSRISALKTAGTIVTASRRWKGFADVAQEMMPAIYQIQIREAVTAQKSIPSLTKMSVELYIYCWQQDETAPYSSTLNPILDAIDATLKPDNPIQQECTLDGLVSKCRVSGDIEIFEGVNEGRQIVAIVPIEIFAM